MITGIAKRPNFIGLQNFDVCGEVSDDTGSTGEVSDSTGGTTPIVSGSESDDGDAKPSAAIQEDDIKAGEALLGLMRR
eukprot:CAMPEP_0118657276 /NCGR_PEP_ID=MMETSP0785-20121206/13934_1 /TAXON_ID=91992 /ORGANISM="Bolidomonas pacifica, Strain CCMP 1866" /LENGTH=77 /DNA_ID=CAMNT_0006550187 /DNA_START=511 /DNA_END=744 /DNA_ORIENTATION=-